MNLWLSAFLAHIVGCEDYLLLEIFLAFSNVTSPKKYQNAKIDDIPSFVIDRGKYHIETESAVKSRYMDRTRYRNVSRAQQERQTWSKKEITSVGFRVKRIGYSLQSLSTSVGPNGTQMFIFIRQNRHSLFDFLAASKDKPFGLQAAVLLGEGCARISNRPSLKCLSSVGRCCS